MNDPYKVSIAPQLYEKAYEQLAKPHGISVEQAVNQMLAAGLEAGERIRKIGSGLSQSNRTNWKGQST